MKLKLTLLVLLYALLFNKVNSQTINNNFITTDGAVNAMAVKGDTLYLGGAFNSVGLSAEKLAHFTKEDSIPRFGFPTLETNSNLTGLVQDGRGGYFLVTSGCDCCQGLHNISYSYGGKTYTSPVLHLREDFSVDTTFPSLKVDGCLFQAKKSEGKLYLSGNFTKINGMPRINLAALNISTGKLTEWAPSGAPANIEMIEANNSLVVALAEGKTYTYDAATGAPNSNILVPDGNVTGIYINNDTLYYAGQFNHIAYNVSGLATFNENSFLTDTAFPHLAGGSVNAMVKDDSGGYFVAGNFFQIGNYKIQNLAHIFSNGKVDTSFNFLIPNAVLCMARDKNLLYIGGTFNIINNEPRGYGACINLTTKQLTNFNPEANLYIESIEPAGDTIYLGGDFYTLKNTTRYLAGAVTTHNVLTSWDPNPDQPVFKIISNKNNSSLFISGEFQKLNGQRYPHLAKVDAVDGKPFNWKPSPNQPVYSMVEHDGKLYIGGGFSKVNDTARSCLAVFDTASLALTSFAPNPDGGVQAMSVFNNKLYIAGYFTKILSETRPNIAGINLGNNTLTPFKTQLDGEVMRSILYDGNKILAGGDFKYLYVSPRNSIASINLSRNQLNIFNTGNSINGNIYRMYRYKNDLFVAGDFYYYYGLTEPKNLIGLSIDSGKLSYHFSSYPDFYNDFPYYNSANQLIVNDNKLYMAGKFQRVLKTDNDTPEADRLNTAVYDLTTLNLSNEVYNTDDRVLSIIISKPGNITLAGEFNSAGNTARNYLTAVNLKTRYITNWHPKIGGNVNALVIKDSVLYAGGKFRYVNGTKHSYFVGLSTATGQIKDKNHNINNTVDALAIKDSLIYIGGVFSKIDDSTRNHAASILLNNDEKLTKWNPDISGYTVYSILPYNSNVYIGGSFYSVNSMNRRNLAKVNNTSGKLFLWNPDADGYVTNLNLLNDKMYVSGAFQNIKSTHRTGLAVININTLALTNFDADIEYKQQQNGLIYSTAFYGKNVYIGGEAIESIKNKARGSLAAIDTTGSIVSDFNPRLTNNVQSLLISKSRLFAGGAWKTIGGKDYPNFAVFTLPPTLPANSFTYTNIQSTSVDLIWQTGDGENRLITATTNNIVSAPTDGKSYTANSVYGMGATTALNSYVVYNGNGNNASVTNLLPNHTYKFSLFEYNGMNDETAYLKSDPAVATITTPCPLYQINIDSSSSLNLCPANEVTLNIDNEFTSFLWNNGDTTNSTVVQTEGNYYVIVKDSNGCTAYSDTVTVKVKPCQPPLNLSTTNITATKAKLNWAPDSCAQRYRLQTKADSAVAWNTIVLYPSKSSYNLTGLVRGTKYLWRIATVCSVSPSIVSNYSDAQQFTTGNELKYASGDIAATKTDESFSVNISPNPVTNKAFVKFSKASGNIEIKLTEISGRVLWQNKYLNTSDFVIPMKHLSSGAYFITITNKNITKTFKVVKQ